MVGCLTAQIKSREVRTVTQIMSIIKSPFVTNFDLVSSEILGASEEAISNLDYLGILIHPCTILRDSKVKDIPDQRPNLLSLIREIRLNSPHYNTLERLNSLLRKVSNEIIRHCVQEIDVDKVFSGHIDSAEEIINECISCCKRWKEAYFEAERYHHINSPYLSWLLEYDHIFSHVDAFIHRLQDLLEIKQKK
jgi:dynein heavy chain